MGDTVLSRFSRRTSGGRWIPEVDGLRFLAIALVLADHVAVMLGLAAHRSVVEAPFGSASLPSGLDPLTTIFRQGAVGVQVFFMVSGFVLALPFIRSRSGGDPVDLRRYLRRRVTRIEPPYLIVMLLLLVGASFAGTHVGLGHVAASLAYLHGAYYGTASPLNSVAWSLEIEVQFYLLVPALALLLCVGRRRMRRGRILLLALAAVALQAVGLVTAYTFLGSSIQFFLLGWLLADIYIEDWQESPATARIWDVVAVAALATLVVGLAEVRARPEQALAPWAVFALGYASFRGTGTRRILSIPWIATIGGMCYSIYLVHYPLFVLMSRWLTPVARWPSATALLVASVVLVPLALAVGATFFVLIERPCMDPAWPEKLRDRLRATRDAVVIVDDPPIVLPDVERVSVSQE